MELVNMSKTFCFLAFCALSGSAVAQTLINGGYTSPAIDRWMYPFAGTPGAESSASIFRTPSDATISGAPAFDDRDAEFLLIFNTSSLVPTGKGYGTYDVSSLRVRVFTSNEPRFAYDPTFDSVTTCYATTDAQYTADTDAGKPIELFAAGFRSGAQLGTWAENSAFAPTGVPGFLEGVRRVYPALLSASGTPTTDVSNQVRDRFEATPLSIGTTTAVPAGELVPQGSEFVFDIDLTSPAAKAYFARGFDQGRVAVIISGLHLAAGGPGGGVGDATYPAFYTKENITAVTLGLESKLNFSVTIGNVIDFNNNTVFPEDQDVIDFFNVLAGAECETCRTIDVNGNGVFPEDQDVIDFFTILAGGPCCN
ncbi:MAG TPA: hypothetical protein VK157_03025 [Phycisphaerales bacterium]|nr:hypothetical protein [Phycisphaerales bacterium]